MRDQKNCFGMVSVLLFLLYLLSGCHTGRLSSVQHVQREAASTRMLTYSDSLHLSQQIQTSCWEKYHLEHIEFSSPDSMEKQYVRSVTRLVGDKGSELSSAVSKNVKNEEKVSIDKKEKIETNKSTKVSSSFWWGGVILLVIGGGGLVRKTFRNNSDCVRIF